MGLLHIADRVGGCAVRTARFGIGNAQRHLQRRDRTLERFVLGRLGGLIEQKIDADGARALLTQRRQQIGKKLTIDRGAVGKLRQSVFGDRNNDDVGVLGLGRRQGCHFKIDQILIGAGQERQMPDRHDSHECASGHHQDGSQSFGHARQSQPR